MARTWQESTDSASLSEWQRVPHLTSRDRRSEEVTLFRERLVASLRAGHGLGVGFHLRLDSGPSPKTTLGCSDPASARWIHRILVPAYGRASWTRGPLLTTGRSAVGRLWGRRVRAWPEALREPTDGPSALDSLSLAMRAVPPGVTVRWEFFACPATWNRLRDLDGREVLRPAVDRRGSEDRLSSARRYDSPPSVRPDQMPRPFPLFWKSTVCVSAGSGDASDLPMPERVQAAVEGALRSGRANGIRFSHSHLRLPWAGPPWVFLSEEELASILPGMDGGGGPADRPGDEGLPVLPLGRSSTGRVVGPPVEPGQGRHLAVLGETGMGKSSTLVAVARTAAALGGVVLFDPLGDTARSFLAGLPEEERARLVLVSPSARGSGINALEGIGGDGGDAVLSDRRLNDLVHALRRVRSGRYADSSYWGPRLEEMLTRAVHAAASLPSGTLADAHALLATRGRMRQVVPAEAQESVRELADRVRERPDDAEGARRLLYEVVRSPVLNLLLCERAPTLHVRELVAPGRIAVVSGDASTVGESVARYLLAVYLALVWSELLARPVRSKTFVVLDESQWFSHESLAEMLRLARRGNVHVVLATQTVGSLPETVADAVWTNVSDFVAFRGSPEEARELSRAVHGLSVEEMLSLPRGHAAVLLGKGNAMEWVRTVGRPPVTGADPLEEGGTLRGSTEGSESAASPTKGRTVTAEEVLEWISGKVPGRLPGEPLRVELAELRREVDPSGGGIREAGARLGRAGAILTSTRSPEGSVWVLDTARIPTVTRRPSPSAEASQVPQPS